MLSAAPRASGKTSEPTKIRSSPAQAHRQRYHQFMSQRSATTLGTGSREQQPVRNNNFRGVRISKFRHVYGTGSKKEDCYEGIRISGSAHDSQFCAVNPKFLAVALEVAGGGAFQVIPLKSSGRVDYKRGRVSGHNGPVTDLKWNPFNDNLIASASDDCTIKLWHIPDEIHDKKDALSPHTDWLCELTGHTRRVSVIEWHPTADNILASAGFDNRVGFEI